MVGRLGLEPSTLGLKVRQRWTLANDAERKYLVGEGIRTPANPGDPPRARDIRAMKSLGPPCLLRAGRLQGWRVEETPRHLTAAIHSSTKAAAESQSPGVMPD